MAAAEEDERGDQDDTTPDPLLVGRGRREAV